ncbi:MAG: hypothetical protein KAY04_03570 [Burkholderiales bacterium]|jgi:hypothetical protein|nr:hypothetical protein [Burkholderiales bacterium]
MNDTARRNGTDSLPASEIDPAMLAELTRALLPYLGPYSITTVKRASRATSDPQEAVRMVAGHIDDAAKRELFLKSARRIISSLRTAESPAAAIAAPHAGNLQKTGGRPATPITPELMQRGEAALAPIIGPLASVLVMRYANAAENSREFFERLAGHLRSAEERDSFFLNIRASAGMASAHR